MERPIETRPNASFEGPFRRTRHAPAGTTWAATTAANPAAANERPVDAFDRKNRAYQAKNVATLPASASQGTNRKPCRYATQCATPVIDAMYANSSSERSSPV